MLNDGLKLSLIVSSSLLMTASTAFAASDKKSLNLKSDPPRTLVTLRRVHDNKKIKQCVTPCRIKVKSKYSYRLQYLKSGYIHKTIKLNDATEWALVDEKVIELNLNRHKSEQQIKTCERARREASTIDQDAKLCWLPPPSMPRLAKFGGNCKFRLDVSATGQTENVKVISCSDSIFEDKAMLSVLKSEYTPKRVNNNSIPDIGKQITITFQYNRP